MSILEAQIDTRKLASKLAFMLSCARERANRDATYSFRIALNHLERGEIESAAWWAGHGAIAMNDEQLPEALSVSQLSNGASE